MIGIDVSNAQGNIDWNKVKSAGVEFVIIRCGWGSDSVKQDDPKFNEYATQCEKLGIPYGVYLYSYALNIQSVVSEANHTLRMLANHKPKYGVWFDMEDADHYKQKNGFNVYANRQLVTDMCKTYCDAIKSHGYECGIYAALDYWKNVLYKDRLKQYPLWCACWGPSNPPMDCTIWQYADNGSVAGINGKVDMDIMYPGNTKPVKTLPANQPAIIYCDVKVQKELVVPGSVSDDVKLMQLLLNYRGYNCGSTDGVYGTKTKNALGDYQRDHIDACGGVDYKCGSKTWGSLLS